jgi:hypothetical protein
MEGAPRVVTVLGDDDVRDMLRTALLHKIGVRMSLEPRSLSALCVHPFERVTRLCVGYDWGRPSLTTLPPILFVNLPCLQSLLVAFHELTTLPMAIGRCRWLNMVDVAEGSMERLPPTARHVAAIHVCGTPLHSRLKTDDRACVTVTGQFVLASWRCPRRAALALLRLSVRLHRDLVRMVCQAILWTANEIEWN